MAVEHGIVEPNRLARFITDRYDLGPISGCRHLVSGVNHTYAVAAGSAQYAIRVHGKKKWWINNEDELLFELELLDHLRACDVPVSGSIPAKDGRRLLRIDTSIGPRRLALFTWAPGKPDASTTGRAYRVGAALAAIHLSADTFHTTLPRYRLDLAALLDRWSGQFCLQQLPPAQAVYVERCIDQIRERTARFDPGWHGWGIIHGDVQGLNYHFDEADRITFFDFDLCGYGWRAYDIAYYYTRIPAGLRGALIRGYESIRLLSAAEHAMLPTFGRLAWIREGCQSHDLLYRMRKPYMSFT